MTEMKRVVCSQCGDYDVYDEGDNPADIINNTGFTWGIYSESESVEPVKRDKITEDMIWLCPSCGSDKDKTEGC